ncbi:2OG-Fe(II) oxygenase [Streptomyces sp. NBC_01268]|uniref:2OG-Fe(II) oxygenase n=1 Tax=unclassified Streptomyces TaxID=2593676 RepID=UPI002E34307E|nr:2OG-Fe(II) oxygenase [Streptomyces sp. NBC_01268]
MRNDTARVTGQPGQWATIVPGLAPDVCAELAERCRSLDTVATGVVGQESLPDHRVGHSRLLPRSALFEDVYQLIWDAAEVLNRHYFELDVTEIVKPPQFLEYVGGHGHFHWHNDYGLEKPLSKRKLTVSIQLSDGRDYEGGDLEVFGTPQPMPRTQGSIIVLPAFVHHKVTPVTSGIRCALVGWLAGPPLR